MKYRPFCVNPAGLVTLILATQDYPSTSGISARTATLHNMDLTIRPFSAVPFDFRHNPSAFTVDQGACTIFRSDSVVAGCFRIGLAGGDKIFEMVSMYPHEVSLGLNLIKGAPKNDGLNDQSKELESPNNGQPLREFDQLPLSLFVLATVRRVGVGQIGSWFVGSRRNFFDGFVTLVGLLGSATFQTTLFR